MEFESDLVGFALLWFAFMTVCGIWAVRIAMLVHHQRLAERYYRERLAWSMGAAVRERSRTEGGIG